MMFAAHGMLFLSKGWLRNCTGVSFNGMYIEVGGSKGMYELEYH